MPEHRVVQWLDEQPLETLFVSTVTVADLRFGVGSLPDGKRRNYLLENLENRIIPAFTGRVLPFDLAATAAYAELMIKARAAGLSIGVADGYIAAIASANNMIVATRDVSPFEAVGLRVINPWEVG